MDMNDASLNLFGREKGQFVGVIAVSHPQLNKAQAQHLCSLSGRDYVNLDDSKLRTRRIAKFIGRLADQSTHYKKMADYDENYVASTPKYKSTEINHVYSLIRDERRKYLQIYGVKPIESITLFDGVVVSDEDMRIVNSFNKKRIVNDKVVDDKDIVNYRHLENIKYLGRTESHDSCLSLIQSVDITTYVNS